MIVHNLDQFSDDGFKQLANSANVSTPDNVTHARFYYDDFAGDNYIQAEFVQGKNSTIQADNTGVAFSKFKLFISYDGVNYAEDKTFGGDEGKDQLQPGHILDPADYQSKLITGVTVEGIPQFTDKTLQQVIDDEGIVISGTGGVDYLYVRGLLSQDNSVNSGKAFFGTATFDVYSGTFVSYGIISPEVTIADSYQYTQGAKISTGVYTIQFRSDIGSGLAQTFILSLVGSQKSYIFKDYCMDVYKKADIVEVDPEELWSIDVAYEKVGTLVLDVSSAAAKFYYDTGKLLIRTFGLDGLPADNILTMGVTVEFPAFPNLYT